MTAREDTDLDRDYEVTMTVREHWSIDVRAASAAEARQIVRNGKHSGEWNQHNDRTVMGIRVRLLRDD